MNRPWDIHIFWDLHSVMYARHRDRRSLGVILAAAGVPNGDRAKIIDGRRRLMLDELLRVADVLGVDRAAVDAEVRDIQGDF